jgi:hypothetical protein
VATVGAWFATGWIPGRPRRGIGIRSMLRFGSTVTLNTLIVYVAFTRGLEISLPAGVLGF